MGNNNSNVVPYEELLFDRYQLRITTIVTSSKLAACEMPASLMIYVNNNHNQQVGVRVIGSNKRTGGSNTVVVESQICDASSVAVVVVPIELWMPFIGIQLQSGPTVPTTGDITVGLIRK